MSRIVGLTAVLLALFAAPAAGQLPTTDAYGGAGGLLGEVASGERTPSGGTAGRSAGGGSTPSGGTAGESAGGGSTPSGGIAGESASGGSTPSGTVAAGESASDVRGEEASAVSTGAPISRPLVTTGQLPFTGLDVGFLAAGSMLLVVMGFALRRLGRSSARLP